MTFQPHGLGMRLSTDQSCVFIGLELSWLLAVGHWGCDPVLGSRPFNVRHSRERLLEMMLRSFSSLIVALAVTTALSGTAFAAPVIGPADAGRVEQPGKKAPNLQAPLPKVEVKTPNAAGAPAGADKIKLTLKNVSFDGMTVYTPAELQGVYADKIGKQITLADVYTIANALTAKYRNDGYILTQVVVPPQTIDGGNVNLRVVEGFIDNVTVDGVADDSEREMIKVYADRARTSRAMNVHDLEQAVLLINDLPGVTARSVLSPSPNKVGAADLRIIVERNRFDGLVSLDNYGSRYLGQYEATAAFAANSLLGLNERIGTQLVYAPGREMDKELLFGDISYSQPVGRFGTKIELNGALTSTDPGYTLSEFDINGRSVFLSAKVDQPIIRTRALNWGVYGLLDGRNVDTDSNIEATRTDHIRALRIGSEVDYLDTFFGAGYNTFNIELSKGLGILGASQQGDANMSRTLGDPKFSKVEMEFQRLQRLTNKANLLVGVKGQHSTDNLLSSEEFGVGGSSYGRGYDPSEIVGDDGVAGKLEVQFNNPIAWNLVDTYQLYGFLDGGRVWNGDATTSADKKISLSSTGVGIRATFPAQTQAGAYIAIPLSRDVQSMGDQDARFYFNVAQPF